MTQNFSILNGRGGTLVKIKLPLTVYMDLISHWVRFNFSLRPFLLFALMFTAFWKLTLQKGSSPPAPPHSALATPLPPFFLAKNEWWKRFRVEKWKMKKKLQKRVIYSGAEHNSSYFPPFFHPLPQSFVSGAIFFPCGFVVATVKNRRVETALRTLGAFEIDGRKIFMHP